MSQLLTQTTAFYVPTDAELLVLSLKDLMDEDELMMNLLATRSYWVEGALETESAMRRSLDLINEMETILDNCEAQAYWTQELIESVEQTHMDEVAALGAAWA